MNGMATFVLSYVGLAALALAMARHQNQALGRALDPLRSLQIRSLGWVLVLAAVAPAIDGWGVSVGISLWLGAISLAAIICGLVFSYVPRQAVGSAMALAVLGVICQVL